MSLPASTSAQPAELVTSKASETYGGQMGDTTDAWTTLSEAMSDHDGHMIQDWKDDLGNLLVFAGLFSGVVAGFALESYGWLQQDTSSQDVSVQLLAQISLQLASFSVSQGFFNSTVVPIPLTALDAPPGPSELDIRINTLWFLSLAISLIASLLAIMVQQWLREYRLPGHLSIREHVRLRQYRFNAFKEWGVPQIVSILPILLQIALILFLVGLCYLLASLDKTVAKAFIAFVGIALSAYFAFTVLPIAFRQCPYKNPIAHGCSVTARTVIMLILIAIAVTGMGLYMLLVAIHRFWRRLSGVGDSNHLLALFTSMIDIASTALKLLKGRSDLDGHEYWTARELNELPAATNLDRDALVWAPSGVSKVDIALMDQCLHELSSIDQMHCVCAWALQTLGVDIFVMSRTKEDLSSACDSEALARIDKTFSDRFRHSFLAAMPAKVRGHKGPGGFYESTVLAVLRHIARLQPLDTDWTIAYARRLLDIRDFQTLGDESVPWERLPTACLFELSTIVQYEFSAKDASALFDFAIENFNVPYDTYNPIRLISVLDIALGSYGAALHVVARQPTLLEDPDIRGKCRQLLKILDDTVTRRASQIRRQGMYTPDYFSDGVLLVSVPACNSLCSSVVSLAQMDAHPFDDNLTSTILLHHLIQTFERQPPFQEGLNALLACQNAQQGISPSVTAVPVADNLSGPGGSQKTENAVLPEDTDVAILGTDTSEILLQDMSYEDTAAFTQMHRPAVGSDG